MKVMPLMNKCLYCGAKTPAASKFCIHCGKNIEKYNEYCDKRGVFIYHIIFILFSMFFRVPTLFDDYAMETHNIEDSAYIATLILDVACLPFLIILIKLIKSYKFWVDATKAFNFKVINIFYFCLELFVFLLQIVIW